MLISSMCSLVFPTILDSLSPQTNLWLTYLLFPFQKLALIFCKCSWHFSPILQKIVDFLSQKFIFMTNKQTKQCTKKPLKKRIHAVMWSNAYQTLPVATQTHKPAWNAWLLDFVHYLVLWKAEIKKKKTGSTSIFRWRDEEASIHLGKTETGNMSSFS